MDSDSNFVSCIFVPAYLWACLAYLSTFLRSRYRNNRHSHYCIFVEAGAFGLAYSSAFALYLLGL